MDSPGKSQRKSLADLFTDLEIAPSPMRSSDPSPVRRSKMRGRLRDTISAGWPVAAHHQETSQSLSMTIRADDIYREYTESQDPQTLFKKAGDWLSTVQKLGVQIDDAKRDIIDKELHDSIIRAIFGSNRIEHAGLGLDITIQLCKRILAGEDVGEITERDANYMESLGELVRLQPDLRNRPAKFILRGRSEIVQHARAYQYLINQFVVEKKDLTEDLIKETHKILTKGVPIIHHDEGHPDTPPEAYGGVYRTVVVGAGTTNFSVPKFVPSHMKQMCEALKLELDEAERTGKIDPFSVAAKYSLEFVQIHPFEDGNGRTCRMILNAILCRYAGVVVPIGEREEERKEYMGIKQRSSRDMEGHGEYATFVLQRATTRLRELKKKLAGKSK